MIRNKKKPTNAISTTIKKNFNQKKIRPAKRSVLDTNTKKKGQRNNQPPTQR